MQIILDKMVADLDQDDNRMKSWPLHHRSTLRNEFSSERDKPPSTPMFSVEPFDSESKDTTLWLML